ncbi:Antiviral helicase ski2 [Pleurotus ostreatus]|nr:Antiviral helicase ski2 [Pleurotus ostreatus]
MDRERHQQVVERIADPDPNETEQFLEELGLAGLPSREQIHRQLEERFLEPKDRFPDDLLPLFQTTWDYKLEIPSLLQFEPSPPPTSVSLVRKGLDGEFSGWVEVKCTPATFAM